MIKEEIKNSGIYYYNYPLCNEPFGYCEFERETPYSDEIGFFECKNCNQRFYSAHRLENIITVSTKEYPIFEAPKMDFGHVFKLHKMQYGKEVSDD